MNQNAADKNQGIQQPAAGESPDRYPTSFTLTTVKNGKTQEWVTIIEDGIPVWVQKNSIKKHDLMEKLSELFHQAIPEDEEPVVEILCHTGNGNPIQKDQIRSYQVSWFPAASLYLCEELEGRYATLSSLTDALWELLAHQTIDQYRLL